MGKADAAMCPPFFVCIQINYPPPALATARLTPGESHRQTSLASEKRNTKFSEWNGMDY